MPRKLTVLFTAALLFSLCLAALPTGIVSAAAPSSAAVPATARAAAPAVAAAQDVPILMYHSLSENPKEWDATTVSPAKFKSDMITLKVNGYTPIFFNEYADAIHGQAIMPYKAILITFDDGYSSNYTYAYPILKQLNMKATISMIGWSAGRSVNKDDKTAIYPHFSWEEAKEMYDSGVIDIQHHTYDLHNLTDNKNYGTGVDMLPMESQDSYRKRFKADVLKMKELIETKVGGKVTVFTYPYGKYNLDAEAVLKELGFTCTLAGEGGISYVSKGTYLLKRINIVQNMSSQDLITAIEHFAGDPKK